MGFNKWKKTQTKQVLKEKVIQQIVEQAKPSFIWILSCEFYPIFLPQSVFPSSSTSLWCFFITCYRLFDVTFVMIACQYTDAEWPDGWFLSKDVKG